jgi:hypothetical protein
MRARRHIALLACLALAQAGCGGQTAGAAAYSCSHMRDTAGAFRDQARLIVDREGFNACRGAAAGTQPYDRVASADPVD